LSRLYLPDEMSNDGLPSKRFFQHEENSLVLECSQLLGSQTFSNRELHGLRDHGTRRYLGVMKVNAFGKCVANAEQIDQFGQRVPSQHAMLLEVDGEAILVHDEGLENPLIVIL